MLANAEGSGELLGDPAWDVVDCAIYDAAHPRDIYSILDIHGVQDGQRTEGRKNGCGGN